MNKHIMALLSGIPSWLAWVIVQCVKINLKIAPGLKPLSYLMTVRCWRKKSRLGRPVLKDRSDPSQESTGSKGGSFPLLYLRFAPGAPANRSEGGGG